MNSSSARNPPCFSNPPRCSNSPGFLNPPRCCCSHPLRFSNTPGCSNPPRLWIPPRFSNPPGFSGPPRFSNPPAFSLASQPPGLGVPSAPTSYFCYNEQHSQLTPTNDNASCPQRQPRSSPWPNRGPAPTNGMMPALTTTAFNARTNQGAYTKRILPTINLADQNPPCSTLYVGNLPMGAPEQEVRAVFSRQRGYRRLRFYNKPKGPMCFVEFEDIGSATKALCELYGHNLSNSVHGGLRLSFSKSQLGIRTSALAGAV